MLIATCRIVDTSMPCNRHRYRHRRHHAFSFSVFIPLLSMLSYWRCCGHNEKANLRRNPKMVRSRARAALCIAVAHFTPCAVKTRNPLFSVGWALNCTVSLSCARNWPHSSFFQKLLIGPDDVWNDTTTAAFTTTTEITQVEKLLVPIMLVTSMTHPLRC